MKLLCLVLLIAVVTALPQSQEGRLFQDFVRKHGELVVRWLLHTVPLPLSCPLYLARYPMFLASSALPARSPRPVPSPLTLAARVYASHEESSERFFIFKENLRRAQNQQAREQGTAQYGVTEFMDMTPAEFRATRLGNPMTRPDDLPVKHLKLRDDPPTAYDWRDYGAVTDVKNQGMCGSCWAFSTTGNIEGVWVVDGGNDLIAVSEQQIIDCDTADAGCNGGLMSQAMDYVIQQGGIETEKDYPYEGTTSGNCRVDEMGFVANITGYAAIPEGDEDALLEQLLAHGPVSIAMNAEWLQFYMGGISDPWWCNKNNLDHGILIVGFGSEDADNKHDFWIVKNSWGPSWGEDGYFRIIRGKDKCGVAEMAISASL
jgi:cathepsin F